MKLFRILASAARWCWKWPSQLARGIWRGLAAIARRCWKWIKAGQRSISSRRGLAVLAVVAAAFVLGIVASQAWGSNDSDDSDNARQPSAGASEPTAAAPDPATEPTASDRGNASETDPANSSSPAPDGEPSSSTPAVSTEPTPPAPQPTHAPIFVVFGQNPPPYERALEIAAALAPDFYAPSGCASPLPHAELLPNAPRAYRFGIHQGVDFRCFTLGHFAFAALDGRVVVAVGDFADPDPDSRDLLLDIASELKSTPPFTLLTLYGNYVVIDHGIIENVGHVVSIYAHLEAVDPGIRVGQLIRAGQRIGEIGNRGTLEAANGDFDYDPQLHWELHVNNLYLGAGLSPEETREVYTTLLSDSLG